MAFGRLAPRLRRGLRTGFGCRRQFGKTVERVQTDRCHSTTETFLLLQCGAQELPNLQHCLYRCYLTLRDWRRERWRNPDLGLHQSPTVGGNTMAVLWSRAQRRMEMSRIGSLQGRHGRRSSSLECHAEIFAGRSLLRRKRTGSAAPPSRARDCRVPLDFPARWSG